MNSLQIARDISIAVDYIAKQGWKLSSKRFDPINKSVCILSAIKLKKFQYILKSTYTKDEYFEMQCMLTDKLLLESYDGISTIRDALGIMTAITTFDSSYQAFSSEQYEWQELFKVALALKDLGEFDKVALLLKE